MTDQVRKLNLDEVFDDAQALEVLHEDVAYRLPRLKTLSPKKLQKFQELGKKAFQLQNLKKEDATAERVGQVEGLIDEMLTILCRELPLKPLALWQRVLVFLRIKKFAKPLTFNEKMRVATFYMQEGQEKKVIQGVPKRIGRK